MYYNIHYEVVAIFLLILLLISRKEYIKSEDQTTRRFVNVLVLGLFTSLFDIFVVLCSEGLIPVNDRWMLIIQTTFMILEMVFFYWLLRMVCSRTGQESETFHVVNFLLVVLMFLMLFINLGPHFVFEYVDHKMVIYPLYYAINLLYVVFFLEMAFLLITRGRKLRRKVFFLTSSIFFFPVLCVIIQSFNDRLLMMGIGATGALLMFSFTLGDEEYESLQNTMQELASTREEEQQNLAAAEASNRVKDLFMENISNEFKRPVQDVLNMTEQMRKDKGEVPIDDYLDRVNDAGNELLSFVDELIVVSKKETKQGE